MLEFRAEAKPPVNRIWRKLGGSVAEAIRIFIKIVRGSKIVGK